MMLVWICLAAALLCCCMGFKRFVWFMSIGYGYAVAGIAVTVLIYGAVSGGLTPGLAVALVVAACYGIRLGTFLLRRETGNKTYKKLLDTKVGKEPPVFVKVFAWLFMGLLYICETAGLIFRLGNGASDDALLYIQAAAPVDSFATPWPSEMPGYLDRVIMAAGAVIEALADRQKSAQKAARPDMVATQGLFRLVRCPNYFGEMLFWTGVFLSGVTVYQGVWQWVAAVFGYVCIIYIMLDGAKRMEKGHIDRYGQLEEYRAYADKTPLLFPFIPLYHLYDPAKDKKVKQ